MTAVFTNTVRVEVDDSIIDLHVSTPLPLRDETIQWLAENMTSAMGVVLTDVNDTNPPSTAQAAAVLRRLGEMDDAIN